MSSPSKFVSADPLSAGKVAGNLASGIVPDAKSAASKFVKFAPLTAGKVAGNLASAKVPEPNAPASVEERISTLKFVNQKYC